MKDNRIIITGGAGFIGSNLARLALNYNYKVFVVDSLTYAGSLSNLSDILENKSFNFFQTDICDEIDIRKLLKDIMPRGIFNLAAESHVDKSIGAPTKFLETNVIGTLKLLQESRRYWENIGKPQDFRYLQISTDEVFGSLPKTSSLKFNENSPYAPNNPYAASKAGGDHLVRAWNKTFGLPTLITNCTNNYGPFQNQEKFIPRMIISALLNEPLTVYGDGLNIRDWLHVDDHARALLKVFENGTVGETYLIGGNNEISNIDLLKLICDLLGSQGSKSKINYYEQLKFVPDRLGHDKRYAIDFSKTKRELNWVPSVNFRSGLETTIIWYLQNQNWWSNNKAT